MMLYFMKQLTVEYQKRGSNVPEAKNINPLGIVLQGVVHRLICTMDEDSEVPRHLPIHRFKKAIWNGNKLNKPKKFNMDDFIDSQKIGFLISKFPLELEAKFDKKSGFHLTETPISENQKLSCSKGWELSSKCDITRYFTVKMVVIRIWRWSGGIKAIKLKKRI